MVPALVVVVRGMFSSGKGDLNALEKEGVGGGEEVDREATRYSQGFTTVFQTRDRPTAKIASFRDNVFKPGV